MNRKNNLRNGKSSWLIYLMVMYGAIVLVRFLLAMMTTSYPKVGIDEFLYYSLGRSIATEGKLLFRGQSADYAYLVYPLLLSPIYLLFGEGAPFYRLIQLWNIIMMSSSIFPLYFLGRQMFGNEKKAFIFAGISMLLPDFMLGNLIFSEVILYPLFFCLMYCVFRYFERDDHRYLLWAGILGGLLYSTKPGSVVPAAVFLLVAVIRLMIRKKPKELTWVAAGILIFIATAGTLFALGRYIFGYDGGLFSVYEIQLDEAREWDWSIFFKTLAVFPFYFILSCGIAGVLLPLISFGNWEAEKRIFVYYLFASIAVMMIGTAWAIEQRTSYNNIHLRYIAMYMPMMLLLCGYAGQEPVKTATASDHKSKRIKSAILLGYMVLCCLIFGCKIMTQTADAHSQLSISFLNEQFLPASMEWIGNGVIILLCVTVFLFLYFRAEKREFKKICIWMMAACMMVNGTLSYAIERKGYRPELEQDGLSALALTEGEDYIYVLATEGILDLGADINTKRNSSVVYKFDFMNHLNEDKGFYIPFVPVRMRGMSSVKTIPDVDTLIVDGDSFPFFAWSENVRVEAANNHSLLYVVHFTPSQRLADSMMGNLSQHSLIPEKSGIILVYNDDYLEKPMKIQIEADSRIAQTMVFSSSKETHEIDIIPGKHWYEVAFDRGESMIHFQIQDDAVEISAYDLKKE